MVGTSSAAPSGTKRTRAVGSLNDEDDEDEPAEVPKKKRKIKSAHRASKNLIPDEEQQDENEDSRLSTPPPDIEDDPEPVNDKNTPSIPISSSDTPETKYTKQKRSIESDWNVQDSRDVIPFDLIERTGKERKELEKYGKKNKGEILGTLYQLAGMTKRNREGAWAKIKQFYDARKIPAGQKKWLALGDVAQALRYFEERQEEVEGRRRGLDDQEHDGTFPVAEHQTQDEQPNTQRPSRRPVPQPRQPRRAASRTTRPASRRELPTPTSAEDFALQEALNARRAAERALEEARNRRDEDAWAGRGLDDHRRLVDLAAREVEVAYRKVHEAQRRRWEASEGGE